MNLIKNVLEDGAILVSKNSEVFKEGLYVRDYLFRRRGYLPVTGSRFS